MKSLSLLLVSGTILALLVGGLVTTPVQANASVELAAAAAPAGLIAEEASGAEIGLADALDSAQEAASAQDNASSAPEGLTADDDAGSSPASSAETVAVDDSEMQVLTAIAAEEARVEIQAARAAEALENFLASVTNGNAGQPTGIYVDGGFAFRIGGQNGSAGYVTGNAGEVTRFGLASSYGSLGLLAHNYLAGASFFTLSPGSTIHVVYGDGSVKDFVVSNIRSFQALQPNSAYSNFIDLDTGNQLSSTKVFKSIYNSSHPLVLQTCIARDGISTWGRIFVIAVPAK